MSIEQYETLSLSLKASLGIGNNLMDINFWKHFEVNFPTTIEEIRNAT